MRMFRPFLILALLLGVPFDGVRGLWVASVAFVVNELLVLASDLHDERAGRQSRLDGLRRWSRSRLGRLPGWLAGLVRRRRHVSQSSTFASYERVIGDLAWARHSRRDFDLTLRKRLLDAAAVRLERDRGVDLVRHPDRARELLGARAWTVLAPDQPASVDRSAPGVSLAQVEQLVSAIERLRNTDDRPETARTSGERA